MSKPRRKTKAQRESEEKAALRKRVEDIMAAVGCAIERHDDGTPNGVTTVMEYMNILRTIRERFELDSEQDEMVGRPWNADSFENQDTLTDFLHVMGVRA